MHDIQAKVLTVGSRPTKTGRFIYEIGLSDGTTYTTFNSVVATQAQSLVNQDVAAQVDVSQNGQYTNYNLIAIRANGAGGGVLGTASNPIPAGALGGPSPIPTLPQQGRGRDPEVEARIVRQSSMATAFNFVSAIFTGAGPEALDEAKGIALDLAKELFGHAMGKPAAAPQPTPTVPAEVAAQVNEVVGASAVAVGAQATPDW